MRSSSNSRIWSNWVAEVGGRASPVAAASLAVGGWAGAGCVAGPLLRRRLGRGAGTCRGGRRCTRWTTAAAVCDPRRRARRPRSSRRRSRRSWPGSRPAHDVGRRGDRRARRDAAPCRCRGGGRRAGQDGARRMIAATCSAWRSSGLWSSSSKKRATGDGWATWVSSWAMTSALGRRRREVDRVAGRGRDLADLGERPARRGAGRHVHRRGRRRSPSPAAGTSPGWPRGRSAR